MINLEELNLKFLGYWDRCFFTDNTKDRGLIVKDKAGNIKYLSWFELKKMMEKCESKEVSYVD